MAESENKNPEQQESTAQFEPVVRLQEVEVKTFEEDENVLWSGRSKLYLFGETLLDRGTGKKGWKERGTGTARLLQHKEHQQIRFLMRQDHTKKIIANHIVDYRIDIRANAGSDRSYVWSCFDYSQVVTGGEDGAGGESDGGLGLEERIFAIKFRTPEEATEFKEEFEKAQEIMKGLLEGADKEDENNEANEAAEALDSLNVNKDSEKKDEEKKDEEKTEETTTDETDKKDKTEES